MVVLIDPPYQEYERRGKALNQMIAQLVEKMPAGSVVVVEAGRVLDQRTLEDFQSWDIRRYSSTHIAIKVIGGASVDTSSVPNEPAGLSQNYRDEDESEVDLDE